MVPGNTNFHFRSVKGRVLKIKKTRNKSNQKSEIQH